MKVIMEGLVDRLFGSGTDLDAMQMIARAVAIFVLALAMIRASGRRSFGQSRPFDACTTVLLGAVLSRAVVGASPFWPTVCAGIAIVALHRLVGLASLRWPRFEQLVSGDKRELVRAGAREADEMRKGLITPRDLDEAIRFRTGDEHAQVERAVLERDGKISVKTVDRVQGTSVATTGSFPIAPMEIPMSKSAQPERTDATQLLMNDHREVKAMFQQYQKLVDSGGSDDDKMLLAEQICVALTVHTQLEEELFYPASREVLTNDEGIVDEAYVEHAGAKALIAQIKDAMPDLPLYDAKVTVLSEYIDHHVREEETELFPKLRKTSLDLLGLGARMAKLKRDLMSETGAAAKA